MLLLHMFMYSREGPKGHVWLGHGFSDGDRRKISLIWLTGCMYYLTWCARSLSCTIWNLLHALLMRTEASSSGCRKNGTAVDNGNLETKPREHLERVDEPRLGYLPTSANITKTRENTASSL
jgi:hypothetical protein